MSLQVLMMRDDRLAEELLAAHAHLLRALAMRKAAHVVGSEPALAPQLPDRSACHSKILIP